MPGGRRGVVPLRRRPAPAAPAPGRPAARSRCAARHPVRRGDPPATAGPVVPRDAGRDAVRARVILSGTGPAASTIPPPRRTRVRRALLRLDHRLVGLPDHDHDHDPGPGIDGSAMLTIVVSATAMNDAVQRMTRASRGRSMGSARLPPGCVRGPVDRGRDPSSAADMRQVYLGGPTEPRSAQVERSCPRSGAGRWWTDSGTGSPTAAPADGPPAMAKVVTTPTCTTAWS